jgi:hypothetical protein
MKACQDQQEGGLEHGAGEAVMLRVTSKANANNGEVMKSM